MTVAITECVRKLMHAFVAQIAACEEAGRLLPFDGVGEVIIVVDPKGEINTTNILLHHYAETYPIIFLRVATTADANAVEQSLLIWGFDVDTLHDVILALEPEYAEPKWAENIGHAAREISAALLGAIVLEPGSRRYKLLKNASRHPVKEHDGVAIYAKPDALYESEGAEPEIDNLITEYIGVLLDRYDILLEDPSDVPEELLGAIRIIVDDGTVGARLNERFSAHAMILLCLPTLSDANELEYILTQWAADPEMLEEVIRAFRPSHSDLEFYDHYIDQAVDEVAEVFFHTVVIPPDSLIYAQLCEAVGCGQ